MPDMHHNISLLPIILIFIIPSALCDDVGYVFQETGGRFLANATISRYDPSEIVSSTTAGSGTPCSSSNTLGWLQNTFDQRVEPEQVHNDAVDLVQSEGSCTVDQICYLYDYLTKSWRYISDPRCKDYFQYANETLQHGRKSKPSCAGAGDCDDFAILMASMVESIGGTTRIILAYGPLGGHAYAEVYLGDISKEKSISQIVDWLKIKYNKKEISTHQNTTTGDVWLNLDWGENIHQAAHPGGSIFSATEHKPIYIKKDVAKTRLSPSPMALFTHPAESNGGEPVIFDASASEDVDDIAEFNWNFGDNTSGKGKTPNHVYSRGGRFPVTLRVMDGQGLQNSTTSFILVNNPPIARFNYSPSEPQVGATIEFDASGSEGGDGKITNYEWRVGNRKFEGPDPYYLMQPFSKSGNFPVNLTVTNDKGAKNTTSQIIKVIEPLPEAYATYSPGEPKVGDIITFDASQSKDKRGLIIDYEWDFDDGYVGNRITMKHSYLESGTYNVKLTVTNDRNIKNSSTIAVVVHNKTTPVSISVPAPPQSLGNQTAIEYCWGNSTSTCVRTTTVESPEVTALIEKGIGSSLGNSPTFIVDRNKALDYFNQALELNSQCTGCLVLKGEMLQQLGRPDEAIQCYDKAIAIDPSYSEAWRCKGLTLYWMGRYEESIDSFDKALQLNPGDARIWVKKGLSLQAVNRNAEANQAFEKAKVLGWNYDYSL